MKSYRPKGFRSEKLAIKVPQKEEEIIVRRRERRKNTFKSRLSKSAIIRKPTENHAKDNLFLTKTISGSQTRRAELRSASSLKHTFGTHLQNPNARSEIITRFRKLLMSLIEENKKTNGDLHKRLIKKIQTDKNF